MAGLYGADSGWIFIDGYDLRTFKPSSLEGGEEIVTAETTGIGDSAREHTPTGLTQGQLTVQGGLFDTATGSSHDALQGGTPTSPQTADRVACYGFAGQAAGEPFVGFEGTIQTDYKIIASGNDLQRANASYLISGVKDEGVILHALEAKTADWDTESASFDGADDPKRVTVPITSNSAANPTVVTTPIPHGLTSGDIIVISGVAGSSPDINGEQTVTVTSTTEFSVPVNTSAGSGGTGGSFRRGDSQDGGVGYLQVTAFSGFSGFIAKIRDSVDDAVFADLVTFADVTASPAAQRIEVAGEVDRYLAISGDVTGSGSVTSFIGLARN